MSKKKIQNVCIVNFPMSETGSKAGLIPILQLSKVLSGCSQTVCIIAGDCIANLINNEDHSQHVFGIHHNAGLNVFTRIIMYVYAQLKISFQIIKNARDNDIFIFFMMGQDLILPMFTVKLLKKKVILAFASSSIISNKAQKDTFSKPLSILSVINCTLSDKIVLHSTNLMREWNLERYSNKILMAHEYFLDFDKFVVLHKFGERDNLIGYVGRLSEEKGILNFVDAIPQIIECIDDVKFVIVGDGPLGNKIRECIIRNNLVDKVTFVGWVPHDELPTYLNKMKLLVIPSYTESGPIIAMEAMACGTPILITRVGHVANIIDDKKTGFFMDNNDPKQIAKNVVKLIAQGNLSKVADDAKKLVDYEFSYKVAVEKYEKVLQSI